jgi:phage tail protein X
VLLDAICIEEHRSYAERTAPCIAAVLHARPGLCIIGHSA